MQEQTRARARGRKVETPRQVHVEGHALKRPHRRPGPNPCRHRLEPTPLSIKRHHLGFAPLLGLDDQVRQPGLTKEVVADSIAEAMTYFTVAIWHAR